MDTASACGASITGTSRTSIRSFPSRVQGDRKRKEASHDKIGWFSISKQKKVFFSIKISAEIYSSDRCWYDQFRKRSSRKGKPWVGLDLEEDSPCQLGCCCCQRSGNSSPRTRASASGATPRPPGSVWRPGSSSFRSRRGRCSTCPPDFYSPPRIVYNG